MTEWNFPLIKILLFYSFRHTFDYAPSNTAQFPLIIFLLSFLSKHYVERSLFYNIPLHCLFSCLISMGLICHKYFIIVSLYLGERCQIYLMHSKRNLLPYLSYYIGRQTLICSNTMNSVTLKLSVVFVFFNIHKSSYKFNLVPPSVVTWFQSKHNILESFLAMQSICLQTNHEHLHAGEVIITHVYFIITVLFSK